MSNRWSFKNFGRDPKDKIPDVFLLQMALKHPHTILDDYYPGYDGDDWSLMHRTPFEDVTELRIMQRLQRVFLIVFLFEPDSDGEAAARERALHWFAPGEEATATMRRLVLTFTQTKRGPAR